MARLATVTFESESLSARDRIVNTFAFTGGTGATTAEEDALLDALVSLYNDVQTGNSIAIGANMSSDIPRGSAVHTVRLYDIDSSLDGSPHGSPIREELFSLTPPPAGTKDLPSEVSIVVTLHAIGRANAPVEQVDGTDPDFLPDRPKQRHTGRVYFGPLNDNVVGTRSSTSSTVMLAGMPAVYANAVHDLAIQTFPVTLGVAMRLGVWSRKDQRVTALERVVCDNAFDTQRRRGVTASAVSSLLVP